MAWGGSLLQYASQRLWRTESRWTLPELKALVVMVYRRNPLWELLARSASRYKTFLSLSSVKIKPFTLKVAKHIKHIIRYFRSSHGCSQYGSTCRKNKILNKLGTFFLFSWCLIFCTDSQLLALGCFRFRIKNN